MPNEYKIRQDGGLLYQIGKWGALAIIAYYLFTEHRAHVFQYLPFAILLACPLMHFFMHGRHANHEPHDTKENRK